MKSIAITGSFASGKSFVLNYLKSLGYKVFSCDDYVRALYLDSGVQQDLLKIISGLQVFDKKKLIAIIYSDDLQRKNLENYIHPKVREGIEDFKRKFSTEDLLFIEVPLLFETGFNKHFDCSICVYCSENTRRKRAMTRSYFDPEIYNKIKTLQLPQGNKKKLADFSINTDSSQLQTQRQADKIILRILSNKNNA